MHVCPASAGYAGHCQPFIANVSPLMQSVIMVHVQREQGPAGSLEAQQQLEQHGLMSEGCEGVCQTCHA